MTAQGTAQGKICLAIASGVTAGHVGLGATVPALALLGVEAWALPTVQLSGHAATPGVQGRRAPGAEVAALGRGLAAAGALARASALCTGYLGSAEAAEAVAGLAADWRAARGTAGGLWLCDPVLGDDGRLYLPEAVGALYRDRLVPAADIVTPNVFELGWLTGRPTDRLAEIAAAARALWATGPAEVVVTSVSTGEASAPADRLGLLVATEAGAWLATAPRLPFRLNGAGDFVAAVLLAHRLAGLPAPEAAARAVAAAHAAAEAAGRMRRDDLPVVAAAEAWRAAAPATLIRLD